MKPTAPVFCPCAIVTRWDPQSRVAHVEPHAFTDPSGDRTDAQHFETGSVVEVIEDHGKTMIPALVVGAVGEDWLELRPHPKGRPDAPHPAPGWCVQIAPLSLATPKDQARYAFIGGAGQ